MASFNNMLPSHYSGKSPKRLRYSRSMSAIRESYQYWTSSVSRYSSDPVGANNNNNNNNNNNSNRNDNNILTSCASDSAMQRSPRKKLSASPELPITSDCIETNNALRWTKKRPVVATIGIIFIVWIICMLVVALQFHNSSHSGFIWSSSPHDERPATNSGSPPLIRMDPHSIPLPLPKEKVSVVLMNFSRPRMIRNSSMMRTLLDHPNVDEVLLLHANPKTAFEFVHPKVVNIDAVEHNDEMGLSLRFYFCQLAKNNWVIHVDDDMEFTTTALNELFIEYGRNPKRIVGRFGRDLAEGNSFNGYNSVDRHKSTEVVLTKLMVMERDICGAFFEYSHLLWEDVVLHDGEGPLWNGEDIFMSLVANHVYGEPTDGRPFNNYAMDWLDVWAADDSLKDYDNGRLDISGGMKGYRFWDWRWWQTVLRRNRHYSYRGRLWHTARDRLRELGDDKENEKDNKIMS